jgi:hypothetical protein
VGAV